MENYMLQEKLIEALNNFFELGELKKKAADSAAQAFVYNHDVTITEMVEEKLAEAYEGILEDILEDAIENWVENYWDED